MAPPCGNRKHWFAYYGLVGSSAPKCQRCGAPNPKYRPDDDPYESVGIPADAIKVEPSHHPTYMVSRFGSWVFCSCTWRCSSTVSGNQMWAQLQFADHLIATAKPTRLKAS
jgi:hypothetical protein